MPQVQVKKGVKGGADASDGRESKRCRMQTPKARQAAGPDVRFDAVAEAEAPAAAQQAGVANTVVVVVVDGPSKQGDQQAAS